MADEPSTPCYEAPAPVNCSETNSEMEYTWVHGMGSHNYDQNTDMLSDPLNIVNLQVRSTPLENINPGSATSEPVDMLDLILNESVPVSLSAVMVLGLPYCKKSTFLSNLLTKEISIEIADRSPENKKKMSEMEKQKLSKDCVKNHMEKTTDDLGLSVHTLCVLGTLVYGKAAWSLSSRRLGITYAVVSCIIRKIKIKMFDPESVKFESYVKHKSVMTKSLFQHLKWVCSKTGIVFDRLGKKGEKLEMLANGFSMVNIFDVGVNKAVYDLLPYIAHYCDNLVRIVIFDVKRDSAHTLSTECPILDYKKYKERGDNKFVMRWRKKKNYLTHFASLGHHSADTIFIGFSSDKATESTNEFQNTKEELIEYAKTRNLDWQKHWLEMKLDSDMCYMELMSLIEELITNSSKHKCFLPVKWLFLRSFFSSHSNSSIIVNKKEVIHLANANLRMDENEVNDCLCTFRNYASILHFHDFPQIEQYVITDIYKFTKALSNLYYPNENKLTDQGSSSTDGTPSQNDLFDQKQLDKFSSGYSKEHHATYGILSKYGVAELVKGVCEVEKFMEITTTLRMASEIKDCSKIITPNERLFPHFLCYFVPTARNQVHMEPQPDLQLALQLDSQPDSPFPIFLRVQSTEFPANVQTSISSAMINEVGMTFVLTKSPNVCEFVTGATRFKVLYFGEATELKLVNPATVDDICTKDLVKILNGCCIAFTQQSQKMRGLEFKIGLKCLTSTENIKIHDLPISEDSFKNRPDERCSNGSNDCYKYYSQRIRKLQPWTDAASKSERLVLHNLQKQSIPKGIGKEHSTIMLDKCVSAAKDLENKPDEIIDKFADLLQINPTKVQELKREHAADSSKARLIMALLLLWEHSEKETAEEELKLILKIVTG